MDRITNLKQKLVKINLKKRIIQKEKYFEFSSEKKSLEKEEIKAATILMKLDVRIN